jgi:hypothetical protein
MEALPFEVSFEALTIIAKILRDFAADPSTLGTIPVLLHWHGSSLLPYEHFLVGGQRPENVAAYEELNIWGRQVFVHPSTLEQLIGRRLVVGRYLRSGRAVESAMHKASKSKRLWLIPVKNQPAHAG